MSEIKYCPGCGTRVEASWNACPNCGTLLHDESDIQPPTSGYTAPTPSPAYTPQPASYSAPQSTYISTPRKKNYGLISLIFGLLSCCCCGIVFSFIAIYFGVKGRNEDEDPTLATIGLIIGIIGFIISIISLVLIFMYNIIYF
ncbi:MAG: zinc ribbon domain-containing protein [Promethearchaeota archaeon]